MRNIQGVLAILVTSALIAYLFLKGVDAGSLSLAGLVGTAWGFFFGQQGAQAQIKALQEKLKCKSKNS